MKFILNLFKGLAVAYWLLAAALFTSVLFFPNVIDGLHSAYNGVAGQPSSSEVVSSSEEVISSSDEIVSSSEEIIASSSEEIISSSEEAVSSSEEIVSSSEEIASSSEEIVSSSEEVITSSEESSLPETQPLRANGEVCTLQCIDDPATEEVECLSACEFEHVWIGYPISTEIPAEPVHEDIYIVIDENDDLFYSAFVFVVSTDLNESGEEVVVSEWVEILVPIGQTEGYDFYYDVETQQIFVLELQAIPETGGPDPVPEEEVVLRGVSREEFVAALEEILVYSAIFMLPFTILVFTLSSKLDEATLEIDPNPEVIIESRKSKKAAVRTRAIGVTRLRVRK